MKSVSWREVYLLNRTMKSCHMIGHVTLNTTERHSESIIYYSFIFIYIQGKNEHFRVKQDEVP